MENKVDKSFYPGSESKYFKFRWILLTKKYRMKILFGQVGNNRETQRFRKFYETFDNYRKH